MRPWVQTPVLQKRKKERKRQLYVVIHTCNPSTQEAEAGAWKRGEKNERMAPGFRWTTRINTFVPPLQLCDVWLISGQWGICKRIKQLPGKSWKVWKTQVSFLSSLLLLAGAQTWRLELSSHLASWRNVGKRNREEKSYGGGQEFLLKRGWDYDL
jgi:hypothetical protein